MPKRKDFRQNANDPFGDNSDSDSGNSVFETDNAIFGGSDIFSEMGRAEAKAGRIAQQNIFDIVPDPRQPRRALPSEIRRNWDGNPDSMEQVYGLWWNLVQQERGQDFDLVAALLQLDSTEDDDASEPGPLESVLLEIVELAASIREEGLTNPITIVTNGDNSNQAGFQIETGERRWLAFHLLYLLSNGHDPRLPDERDKWQKIPARVMEEPSVWRQASENSARQNLNAIGKARQFAILMMDLWMNHPRDTMTFDPFEAFDDEQHFYAQVAELSPPYGQSNRLLGAMGFNNRNAISRYRDLLKLPSELWHLADDSNCPEGVLRDLIKQPPDVALEMFEEWLQNRHNTTLENVTIGDNLQKSVPRNNPKRSSSNRPTLLLEKQCYSGNRLFTKEKEQRLTLKLKSLVALRDGVGQADHSAKSQIMEMMEDIRRMLDEVESNL